MNPGAPRFAPEPNLPNLNLDVQVRVRRLAAPNLNVQVQVRIKWPEPEPNRTATSLPRSNQSNLENHHYPHTLIPENTTSDTQKDKSTVLPAHYDTQRFNTAPRTSPFATPSPTIIIHAQTVVIGSTVPSHTSTQDSSDNKRTALPKRSTRNLEEECQAPAPLTTPSIPPRDLSGLRSRHRHPFSSLQRRSRRRQSMPVRGLNWERNHHYRDLSQTLQMLGWTPPRAAH